MGRYAEANQRRGQVHPQANQGLARVTPWYLAATVGLPTAETEGLRRLVVAPNPARGSPRFTFTPPAGETFRLDVVDVSGRLVRTLARGVGDGSSRELAWNGLDGGGRRVRPGAYWARLRSSSGSQTAHFILLEGR